MQGTGSPSSSPPLSSSTDNAKETTTQGKQPSSTPASRRARGGAHTATRALQRLEKCFSEGNFYEAQQLIKMLVHRFTTQNNFAEAIKILTSGMTQMLQHKETICASELGRSLIDIFVESKEPVTDAHIGTIIKHFNGYPADVDDGKVDFIKAAIKWTATMENEKEKQQTNQTPTATNQTTPTPTPPGKHSHGDERLHDHLGKWLWGQGLWGDAQHHFARGRSPDLFAAMLNDYAREVEPHEVDLVLARAVFMCLGVGKLRHGRLLMEAMLARRPGLGIEPTPLLHYVSFLLEALALGPSALPLVQRLTQEYMPALQRDPDFKEYLQKISWVFFKLKPNEPSNFLSEMLRSLLGAPQSSSS
jgi:hypothetical protein